MGFAGFSGLQRLFRAAYAPGWPDHPTRLRDLQEGGHASPSTLVAELVEAGRMPLESLTNSVDKAAFARAAQLLGAASTVHVTVLSGGQPSGLCA